LTISSFRHSTSIFEQGNLVSTNPFCRHELIKNKSQILERPCEISKSHRDDEKNEGKRKMIEIFSYPQEDIEDDEEDTDVREI
jgi:hypothetical protein